MTHHLFCQLTFYWSILWTPTELIKSSCWLSKMPMLLWVGNSRMWAPHESTCPWLTASCQSLRCLGNRSTGANECYKSPEDSCRWWNRHTEILRITEIDEFGGNMVKAETDKMIALVIIITVYYIFSRLICSSPLPMTSIIISVLHMRSLYPKVTQPVLLITALCCLSQGSQGLQSKEQGGRLGRELLKHLRSLKGILLLLYRTSQISPTKLRNFFWITGWSHLE